jgi:hypothetical protein
VGVTAVWGEAARGGNEDEPRRALSERMPQEFEAFARQESARLSEIKGETVFAGGVGSKEKKLATHFLTKRQGQFFVLQFDASGDAQGVPCYCFARNSKYCFELKKMATDKDWLLSRVVHPLPPDFDDSKQGLTPQHGYREGANAAFEVLLLVDTIRGQIRASKLAELPKYRLSSASFDGPRGNILRASFEYELANPQTGRPGVAQSVMDFDTEFNYLPTKLHQTLREGASVITYDLSREYRRGGNGLSGLKTTIVQEARDGAAVAWTYNSQTEQQLSGGKLPETDFTLTAFGFPEPAGVKWEKPFPIYLWLLAGGVVCLATAVGFRKRVRWPFSAKQA